jgi:uncharacterized protein YaaW (UPF0174 family)
LTRREARSGSDAGSTEATPRAVGSWVGSRADAARDGVASAFVLGWHVAELFHANLPRSTQRRQASLEKLVGIGELDPLSRARLLLAQVRADLERAWQFDDSGQPPPDLGPVRSLLQAEVRQPGQLQAAVAQLHQQLLVALTAADFRLGKAYGLGRALAETVLVPDARSPQTFQQVFARYRLGNLLGWLADLKSAFPPHAAEAVRGSLQAWAAWSEAPTLYLALAEQRPASDAGTDGQPLGTATIGAPAARVPPPWALRWRLARHPRRPQARPVDWGSAADRESATRALHRQGQLWRAILSGEKESLDLLSTDDYLLAADQLLGHIRRLTLGLLHRFWIATALVAAILAAALVTVFTVRAASPVLAAALTAAGAIGLSWKGVASGLARVLAQAQRPLWESELDVAVANALTAMPWERRGADRLAAPDSSPEGSGLPAVDAVDPEQLEQR